MLGSAGEDARRPPPLQPQGPRDLAMASVLGSFSPRSDIATPRKVLTSERARFGGILEALKRGGDGDAGATPSSAGRRLPALETHAEGAAGPSDSAPSGSVFVFGTLAGAAMQSRKPLWCQWRAVFGDDWSLVRGAREGSTHLAAVGPDWQDEAGAGGPTGAVALWQSPINM